MHAIPIDSLLEMLNDAVIVCDAAGRIIAWNAAAEAIYGWTASEAHGATIGAIIPTLRYPDGITPQEAADQLRTTGRWRGMVIHPHRDGSHRAIDATIRQLPVVDGTSSMIAVHRDMTAYQESIAADLSLLQESVNRATLAIERARLRDAERHARRQLENLYAAAQAFMADLRLEAILSALLSALRRGTTCAQMKVQLFNDHGMLEPVTIAGMRDAGLSPPLDDADLERLLATAQPIIHLAQHAEVACWAAFPIVSQDTWIGILQVVRTVGSAITPEEIQYVQALTAQAALAISQSRLLRDLGESKDKLHRLAHQLVMVQEGERARLARELHDGLGQTLTGLKLHVEAMLLDPTTDWTERLYDAKGQVIDILSQVRQLSLDIRPAVLEDLGLIPSLRWLLQRLAVHTGVSVTLYQHTPVGRQPDAMELALYRVVQESVTNIVRHAQVREAAIHVWARLNLLTMLIQDHGCGFDATRLRQEPTGLGLVGMRERMHILGGSVTIDTAPGQGTSITIEVPYATAE